MTRLPGNVSLLGIARRRTGRRAAGLAAVFVCFGLSGCAGFWEDVTSRKSEFSELFNKPNPLLVLKDSTDGDKRAMALRTLREPKQYGGSAEEQDFIVNLLVAAASNEHQPLCRLAAIGSLGHFHDPRAVKGLEDAYYQADKDYHDGRLPQETATVLQCKAVNSLGETGNPEAVAILVRIVGEARLEGAEKDQQQAMDKRIAAARALNHFNSYQATEALVRVLQTEKDVAMRDCAHESLKKITGKDLPDDYQAWNELLLKAGKDGQWAENRGTLDKIMGWFGVGN